ncbi:MAG TPA: dissimilatory-type sulfite reductase subunit beta, partial [Gammaproteobacteria bacterium]|nr:dissimilatory-type sulfite reductase subunit beta [Gammaproteobacteria bacterium]
PPRWPEVGAVVKQILAVYKGDARDWERVGEWVERIGWPAFFEKTGLPFTKFHVSDWKGTRHQLNSSAYIRF